MLIQNFVHESLFGLVILVREKLLFPIKDSGVLYTDHKKKNMVIRGENEWQSFRTKKERKLELVSAEKEVFKGRRKIAVKVVDIFGNDTTRVIEVSV